MKKAENYEGLLEDIFDVLQDLIDGEDSRLKGIMESNAKYVEHLAKKDALNSLKSFIIGKLGTKTLRLPTKK
jgi:hypothetical protein